MKAKQLFTGILAAIAGGLIAVYIYSSIFEQNREKIVTESVPVPVQLASFAVDSNNYVLDFTYAAENTIDAVVHVKTQTERSGYYNPILEFLYGDRYRESQPIVGFGSGVIISHDGYIVTNNHVVKGSDKIYVTLEDKREFTAKLIGTDPSSDLAVLKIDIDDLPYVRFADSDNVKVGEWVLAVGNPFNITSTVTAGIVSAKGRDLNLIQTNYKIESFIQTDAAVNRGNSGGALVNLKGELVGVNTAIISPSGGYAGISFAIPSNIVNKIVEDIVEFGEVQRAILGVSIQDLNAELAKEKNIEKIEGVYVEGIREKSGADIAGIKPGDIIISIQGVDVNSPAELTEQVSRYRPGDKVTVTVKREDKTKQFEVILRNLDGSTKLVKAESSYSILGGNFAELSSEEKREMGIEYGLKVTKVTKGKLSVAGIEEGFVITRVNHKPVNSIDDLKRIIENTRSSGVLIEGINKYGEKAYYALGL